MPEKKIVIWSPDAKTELRAIDREQLSASSMLSITILRAEPAMSSSSSRHALSFVFASATTACCSCEFTPTASKSCTCATDAKPISKTGPQSWFAPISFTKLATNVFASPNSISVLSM
jgi:hypothetical protein